MLAHTLVHIICGTIKNIYLNMNTNMNMIHFVASPKPNRRRVTRSATPKINGPRASRKSTKNKSLSSIAQGLNILFLLFKYLSFFYIYLCIYIYVYYNPVKDEIARSKVARMRIRECYPPASSLLERSRVTLVALHARPA